MDAAAATAVAAALATRGDIGGMNARGAPVCVPPPLRGKKNVAVWPSLRGDLGLNERGAQAATAYSGGNNVQPVAITGSWPALPTALSTTTGTRW